MKVLTYLETCTVMILLVTVTWWGVDPMLYIFVATKKNYLECSGWEVSLEPFSGKKCPGS